MTHANVRESDDVERDRNQIGYWRGSTVPLTIDVPAL